MKDKNRNDIVIMRRQQLTKAAYKVVSQKGYYNFRVKDIAEEAGLSTGLVHYYFKNKQDLLLNLLKEMNNNLMLFLDRGLKESENPSERLKIFMEQAFSLALNEKNYFYVIFDFWTQINRNERMKRANSKLFKSYRDECAKILRGGVEAGIFNAVDVEYTTASIISLIQGMIIQYVIDNDAFDYRAYSEKIIREVLSMILKKN